MREFYIVVAGLMLAAQPVVAATSQHSKPLTLREATHQAITYDDWLKANHQDQQALENQSIAAGTLPDPVISLSAANLPTDTLSLHQEGMTQMKLGISQKFPQGRTLSLTRKKLQQQAQGMPFQRSERAASVTLNVRHLWVNAWLAQQSINLISLRRPLFEQLVDVTESRYQSATGKTRQQDVVKAKLTLTRLDDRLTQLQQQFDAAYQQLGQFLPPQAMQQSFDKARPDIHLPRDIAVDDWQQLAPALASHPLVRAFDAKIEASQTQVDIAKQQYYPSWGVNAGYGWRRDSQMGAHRADLVSVGVQFSLPLFTGDKQDQTLTAARHNAAAMDARRKLLIHDLRARYLRDRQTLQRLNERSQRYQQSLLKQFQQQSQATLNAYTADVDDFADVMQSYIAELNAQLEMLSITAQEQQTRADLAYLLTGLAKQGDY